MQQKEVTKKRQRQREKKRGGRRETKEIQIFDRLMQIIFRQIDKHSKQKGRQAGSGPPQQAAEKTGRQDSTSYRQTRRQTNREVIRRDRQTNR